MSYTSQAVHTQLAVIVTKGIQDLEIDVLSELQKRVFGTKGLGKDNMLPIWTALWLLILTYRETVDVWFSQEHKDKGLPQLAKHMYDMLVSIYSALFRPSSPLWLDWSKTNFGLFGQDMRVMRSMGCVKREFDLFRK